MIVRIWKGLAKAGSAGDYVQHLRNETLAKLYEMKGFIEMKILQRAVGNGIEFLIMTFWEDLDSIEQFAGRDPTKAVVPDTVQEWMIGYDSEVRHYELSS
ncbi:MAG: antibiotic biosynthesis monooxygenase [Bacteroidota bacterium]